MRFGEKGMSAQSGANQINGYDFNNLIQKDENLLLVEMSSEFGLGKHDLKKIKKRLERN